MIMRRKSITLVGLAAALILLGACGSSGGLGDILGGGVNNGTYSDSLRGTVDSVDVNSHSIYLTNVSGYSNLANSNGSYGRSVRVYYDNRTSVSYQGQGFRPEDLERGDEVEIRTASSGSSLVAENVTVTRDISQASSSNYPSSNYPSYPNSGSSSYSATVRGTVRSVDSGRQLIELESPNWINGFNPGAGNSSRVYVQYSSNVGVEVNGRVSAVTGLERGDVVDVMVDRNSSGSTFYASRIILVRDVNSR
jgi:hypothetical protein